MTSEELAKIKKRLTAWLTAVDLPPAIEDVESLLAVVAEQQKEIDHRDKIIHDMTEESTAYRLGVQEGRGEFLAALNSLPAWAETALPEEILVHCHERFDELIPPSRHQQECERLMAENEKLKKQVGQLKTELTETGTGRDATRFIRRD